MAENDSDPRRRTSFAWGERSRGHQALTVVELCFLVVWAIVLVVGMSQAVTWAATGVAIGLILLDFWLTWRALGRLGRR